MGKKKASNRVSFSAITNATIIGITKVVETIPERTGKESLYVFALYLSPSYRYVGASYNTYQALDTTAKGYAKDKIFKNKKEASVQLKWNPDDWDYHENKTDAFNEAIALLQVAGERLMGYTGGRYSEYRAKIDAALVAALKHCRSNGVFESLNGSEDLVLGLVMGAIEPKWFLRNCRPLMGRDAYTALKSEVNAASL